MTLSGRKRSSNAISTDLISFNENIGRYIKEDYCWACFDGDDEENNEILYCDSCNVPVHQLCYDIPVLPKGNWYCEVCKAGKNPFILPCQLCSNKGGVYRQTTEEGKWVHELCAKWMPEAYLVNTYYELSRVDLKRFLIKCDICHERNHSCCIQCNHKRCTRSAHPWCIFKSDQSNYYFEVIESNNDNTLYNCYCKKHGIELIELNDAISSANITIRNADSMVNNNICINKSANLENIDIYKNNYSIHDNSRSEFSYDNMMDINNNGGSNEEMIKSPLLNLVNHMISSSSNNSSSSTPNEQLINVISTYIDIEKEKNEINTKRLEFETKKHIIDSEIEKERLKLLNKQIKLISKRNEWKDKIEKYNLLISNTNDETIKNNLKNDLIEYLNSIKDD